MDNRLKRRGGPRRLADRLFDVDLPEIARALTALARGQASAGVSSPKNVDYVRIHGPTVNVCIDRKFWVKIAPNLKDGFFNPTIYPVEAGFATFDPTTRFDVAVLDLNDPLYLRILYALTLLFPDTIPVAQD